MQHLRNALTPLVQKCQQMYIQCMHQKLYHLTPADYEDFVSIVCAARAAFQITPEGSAQFKEWLQSIRRYVCERYKILLLSKSNYKSDLENLRSK